MIEIPSGRVLDFLLAILIEKYLIVIPLGFEGMVPKRRCEYLAGRLCAGLALRGAGGSGQIGRAKEGYPLWPTGFADSISHAGNLAIACVIGCSGEYRIGLDMEFLMSDRVAYELAPLLFVEQDRQVPRSNAI